jgi:hypothetical protein
MSERVQRKRPLLAGRTCDRASPQQDEIGRQFSKVMRDHFLSSFPGSIVSYLNTPFDPDEEWVKAYKAHNPNWRDSLPWAEPKVARRLQRAQKHVRAVVDSLIRGGTPEQVATILNEELQRVRVTPALWLRSQMGLEDEPGKSPFELRWCRWELRFPDAHQALVDLARLYASGYWRSLRKCPECGTYLLAVGRSRKKYCSRRCMWRAVQHRYRRPETEVDRAQRRT